MEGREYCLIIKTQTIQIKHKCSRNVILNAKEKKKKPEHCKWSKPFSIAKIKHLKCRGAGQLAADFL